MRFEDANEMLKPGYLPFESGYQELDDGKWVVAALTRMPGCRAKMIDWWFSWLGDIEWYRLWHPRDHVYSAWENRVNGRYIGASHIVHEYLAGTDGPLYKLRIDIRLIERLEQSGCKSIFAHVRTTGDLLFIDSSGSY